MAPIAVDDYSLSGIDPDELAMRILGGKAFNATQEALARLELDPSLAFNMFLAGGAFGSVLRGEVPNDYDIYIPSGSVAQKVNAAALKHLGEIDALPDAAEYSVTEYDGKWITSNAIKMAASKVQFVIRAEYADRTSEEITASFEFKHQTISYWFKYSSLSFLLPEAQKLAKEKKLSINCTSSLTDRRIKKFLDQGWTWI